MTQDAAFATQARPTPKAAAELALDISVPIERVGRSSVTIVLHAMKGARERVRGHHVSVCTAIDTWRVVPPPPDLKDALLAYQGAACARKQCTITSLPEAELPDACSPRV